MVILFGQSLGSGPSTHLAFKNPDVGGLLLQSPLKSGLRVLYPGLKTWPTWADIYPNFKLMADVKAPVMVMHVGGVGACR